MASRKAATVEPAPAEVEAATAPPPAEAPPPNIPFTQAKTLIERKIAGGAALIQGHFLRDDRDDGDSIDRPRSMRAWIQLLTEISEG